MELFQAIIREITPQKMKNSRKKLILNIRKKNCNQILLMKLPIITKIPSGMQKNIVKK